METIHHIETSGYIIKKEKVTTIESNIKTNTLVLENSEPYPGYHGKNLPMESIPRSIFLVLAEASSPIEIARVSAAISRRKTHTCYSNYAEIRIFNHVYPCIRVKGLTCFQNIPEIQQCFLDEGMHFRKALPIREYALIKVYKVFDVTIGENGLYHDRREAEKYYFNFPKYVEWDEFEQVITKVKHNLSDNNFDVAMGCLFRYTGVEEIVRVYDSHVDVGRIKNIRAEFDNQLRRYFAEKPSSGVKVY